MICFSSHKVGPLDYGGGSVGAKLRKDLPMVKCDSDHLLSSAGMAQSGSCSVGIMIRFVNISLREDRWLRFHHAEPAALKKVNFAVGAYRNNMRQPFAGM